MVQAKWDEIESDDTFDIMPRRTTWFPEKSERLELTAEQVLYSHYHPKPVLVPRKKLTLKEQKREVLTKRLRATYQIGLECYEIMLKQQGGCCAICKKRQGEISYRLHVDHNHKTGRVRALVCARCNTMIGLVENKKPTIKQVEKYLKEHD